MRRKTDEQEDSDTQSHGRRLVKEEMKSEFDTLLCMKARYRGISDHDLSRKHIYEELVPRTVWAPSPL